MSGCMQPYSAFSSLPSAGPGTLIPPLCPQPVFTMALLHKHTSRSTAREGPHLRPLSIKPGSGLHSLGHQDADTLASLSHLCPTLAPKVAASPHNPLSRPLDHAPGSITCHQGPQAPFLGGLTVFTPRATEQLPPWPMKHLALRGCPWAHYSHFLHE